MNTKRSSLISVKRVQTMNIPSVFFMLILLTDLSRGIAKADFVFGEPTKVPNINSPSFDGWPCVSFDGLELYFESNRHHGGDACFMDIWVAKRSSIEEPWSAPVKLDPPVNTDGPEGSPCISADGLELYFSDSWYPLYEGTGCGPSPSGYGRGDLWVATRASIDDQWGDPHNLGPAVNSAETEYTPTISSDGLSLYFMSDLGNTIGLYVTARKTKDDPWGPALDLGHPVNTITAQSGPFISPDGLSLFHSVRGWLTDIYVSKRPTPNDAWGSPDAFNPVNSPGNAEYRLTYARGDSTLYFARANEYTALDTYDIWQVTVRPIVDLNGDGAVDRLDGYEMLDHWGRADNSLYDVAPLPVGDGLVDAKDLAVLVEHMEAVDSRLSGHWRLNVQGYGIAYDSVGHNDGIVYGNPTWQPGAGRVNGALGFDGTDDYIETPFVLDPAAGPFSVFAWVSGGAPGRVIISQLDSSDLLLFDAQGRLATALARAGRRPGDPLVSENTTIDGAWHHVGLVGDGSHRRLYVDGIEVARDDMPSTLSSDRGLYIGAGKGLEPDSFFVGLFDDVRIYNEALETHEIAELAH